MNLSDMKKFIDGILSSLIDHNSLKEVYQVDNIKILSQITEYILNQESLNKDEVELLSKVLDIANITYNDTDNIILPIEDGVYDLLLEKYKKYDPNYKIGAKPIYFNQSNQNDLLNQNEKKPVIKFLSEEEKKTIQEMVFRDILYSKKKFTKKDLIYQPIKYEDDLYITKRLRNTSHEHPELVGTLDKCKFVLNVQAQERGVFDDDNVKVLERDFFEPLFQRGIMNMQDEYVMILELKYDGISVEADIENGMIKSARTRGDTQNSEASDLTPIFENYIFPYAYNLGIEPFGMKFEAIITETDLYELNRNREQKYINPRTAIIGLTGSSDARKYRDLITLIPLATTLKDDQGEPIDRLVEIEFMNRYFCRSELLRFQVITGNYVNLMWQIKKFVDEAEFARDYLPFMYDGVVLSFYDPQIRKTLGRENSVNKYSVAIKFNAIKKNTIFLGYTFEVGQNGVITPMIHYQPIEFMGARHTKSSGHSYERFKRLSLKIGDVISVEYTNDVMPYVNKMDIERNRNNLNPIFPFPTKCPECGSDIIISESGKSAYCPNMKCKGRSYKRMESTLSKLRIKDFAYESVKLLGVTSIKQLMSLTEEQLMVLGPNDMYNLRNQLYHLADTPEYDYKLIGSLGFSDIAIKTFRLIFEHYTISEFLDLFDKNKYLLEETIDILTRIKGIGQKTVITIYNELPFFYDDIIFIQTLFKVKSYKYADKTNIRKVVFSGFRDQDLSDKLTELGFDASPNNNLTKDTEILIIPNSSVRTSKVDKALKYGIKVLSAQEVREMISTKSFL